MAGQTRIGGAAIFNHGDRALRERAMHIGLMMECEIRTGRTQSAAFQDAFDLAATAEALGFDAVWLAEHHFAPPGPDATTQVRSVVAAPLLLAAAIAHRTDRIRVGTAVLVLPLGHPVRLAEEVATLDHVTGGRFELGVGRSGLPGAYEGYGIPYDESRERFLEYLDVMRRAWTEESLTFRGRYYQVDDLTISPKPFQLPHPPLRAAASQPETYPLMGTLGLPIFAGLRGMAAPELAPAIRAYRDAWRAAGHDGHGDVYLRIPVYVADDATRAHADPEASTLQAYARLRRSFAGSVDAEGAGAQERRSAVAQSLSNATYDELLRDRLAYGTPNQVARRLRSLRDSLGLSGLIMEPNAGGGIAPDRVQRSIRLFAREVAPALRP